MTIPVSRRAAAGAGVAKRHQLGVLRRPISGFGALGIYLSTKGATMPQIMRALGHKAPKMALY
jgi:hypothetical protein